MQEIKALKQEQKATLLSAAELRAQELKSTKDYKDLEKEIMAFQEDPYGKGGLQFDECGFLEAIIEPDLGDIADEEDEVIAAVLEAIMDVTGFFYLSHYVNGWVLGECLGEPVIFNESPERGQYAIYSAELGLKIDKVIDEEHGFLIIEQAMRNHGVFEASVSTDYCGNPTLLSQPFNAMTDAELMGKLDDKEAENDELE